MYGEHADKLYNTKAKSTGTTTGVTEAKLLGMLKEADGKKTNSPGEGAGAQEGMTQKELDAAMTAHDPEDDTLVTLAKNPAEMMRQQRVVNVNLDVQQAHVALGADKMKKGAQNLLGQAAVTAAARADAGRAMNRGASAQLEDQEEGGTKIPPAVQKVLEKGTAHMLKLLPERYFVPDDRINGDVAFCDVMDKMFTGAGPFCTEMATDMRSHKSFMLTCKNVGIVVTPTLNLAQLNKNTKEFLDKCIELSRTVTIGKAGAIVIVNRRFHLYTGAKLWTDLCALLSIRDDSKVGLPFALDMACLASVPEVPLANRVSVHTTNMEFAFSKTLASEIMVDIGSLLTAYKLQGNVTGATTPSLQHSCTQIEKLFPPGGPTDFPEIKQWWEAGVVVVNAARNCTPLKNTYLKMSTTNTYEDNVAPRVRAALVDLNPTENKGLAGLEAAGKEMRALRSKASSQDMVDLDTSLTRAVQGLLENYTAGYNAAFQGVDGHQPLLSLHADIADSSRGCAPAATASPAT